jgi:hypothetical protein
MMNDKPEWKPIMYLLETPKWLVTVFLAKTGDWCIEMVANDRIWRGIHSLQDGFKTAEDAMRVAELQAVQDNKGMNKAMWESQLGIGRFEE